MQIQIRSKTDIGRLIVEIGELSEGLIADFDWASLAPVVAEAADRIFASEGRGQWPQLNEAYAAWKERNYPGKGILELTGAYRNAATQIGAPHNVVEVGDDHLTYGVEGLEYPAYHESKSPRPPHRPVFELLEEDEELSRDVKETIEEHINRKLRSS